MPTSRTASELPGAISCVAPGDNGFLRRFLVRGLSGLGSHGALPQLWPALPLGGETGQRMRFRSPVEV
jgi:hypothetical protein